MQSENASRDDIDAGADSDSLFGSPPSSPTRGRSPTPPLLAFPSGVGSAQNVGTLALPGSHLVAELPVHPPVLPPVSIAPQPALSWATPSHSFQTTWPPSSSRPSIPGPSAIRAPAPRKRKAKEKSISTSSSSPTPRSPPIELPLPDEPLPPNFLRNQQALLGLAGLIGGVNPAQLPASRRSRGSSAENPIVVEEAIASGTYAQPPSLAPGRRPQFAAINPGQLPVPSSKDILAALVRQKNIFPVVESLLRLLVPGAALPPAAPPHHPGRTGWERTSTSQGPPLKRRKLSSVPAGAADWDVPYPFQAGQGPTEYRTTWEQERARRLLADLLGVVQSAAKKASLQGFLQEQERRRRRDWDHEHGAKVHRHYRPETLLYGLEPGQVLAMSPSPSPPPTPSLGPGTTTPAPNDNPSAFQQSPGEGLPATDAASQSAMPFDELMASIVAASNQSMPASPATYPPPSTSDTSSLPMSSDDIMPYFDNWLSLLSACPPGDPDTSSVSAPFSNDDHTFASTSPSTSSSAAVAAPVPRVHSTANTIPDFLIDPVLLGSTTASSSAARPLNFPSTFATGLNSSLSPDIGGWTGVDTASTPGLIVSPFPSTSSLPDPSTPDLAWSLNELDVGSTVVEAWQNEQGVGGESSAGVGSHGEAQACIPQSQMSSNATASPVTGSAMMPMDLTVQSPSQSPAPTQNAQAQIPPTPSFQNQSSYVTFGSPTQPTPFAPHVSIPTIGSSAQGALAANAQPAKEPTAKEARAQLLARARILRKALVAAAERAKVELWEMTLEQGVLTGLAKESK
ncbi:hypothetical protein B0H21DRAFT_725338 [Amylocystis lapponica]|nr:hypothetical protein B0H21DRAFT_725338 [Amylocystis lapponica]